MHVGACIFTMVRYDVMHTADIPVIAADVAQDNHQAGEHRQQSKHAIQVVQELTRGLVVLQWERFAHHGFLLLQTWNYVPNQNYPVIKGLKTKTLRVSSMSST